MQSGGAMSVTGSNNRADLRSCKLSGNKAKKQVQRHAKERIHACWDCCHGCILRNSDPGRVQGHTSQEPYGMICAMIIDHENRKRSMHEKESE